MVLWRSQGTCIQTPLLPAGSSVSAALCIHRIDIHPDNNDNYGQALLLDCLPPSLTHHVPSINLQVPAEPDKSHCHSLFRLSHSISSDHIWPSIDRGYWPICSSQLGFCVRSPMLWLRPVGISAAALGLNGLPDLDPPILISRQRTRPTDSRCFLLAHPAGTPSSISIMQLLQGCKYCPVLVSEF